jgi:hypothetical protein
MEDLSVQQTTVRQRVATPLVDDVIVRYIEWHGACDALMGASRAWANNRGADCFAELDHEEAAAGRYAAAVRALQQLLWPERQAEPSRSAEPVMRPRRRERIAREARRTPRRR